MTYIKKKKISKKTGKSLLINSLLFVNHNLFYIAVIFFCQILNHCHSRIQDNIDYSSISCVDSGTQHPPSQKCTGTSKEKSHWVQGGCIHGLIKG